jgi:hypothetical protein
VRIVTGGRTRHASRSQVHLRWSAAQVANALPQQRRGILLFAADLPQSSV